MPTERNKEILLRRDSLQIDHDRQPWQDATNEKSIVFTISKDRLVELLEWLVVKDNRILSVIEGWVDERDLKLP